MAKGLFHQVIAQSGGLFEPIEIAPRAYLKNAENEGASYLKSLDVHSVAELRALPVGALIKGEAGQVSHPVVDPYVLPDSPYNLFVAGKQNDVPILVGSNADEAQALLANPDQIKAATFTEDITKAFGALPASLLDAYPHTTDTEAVKARLDFERDIRFGWDMWSWARLQAAKGTNPVYYYHFTHKPPFPKDSVRHGWGASHYADLWYMFDHLSQENWKWTVSDRKLAGEMSGYWANFVKSGNPNGAGLPLWPAFNTTKNSVLYLDDPISTGGVANLKTMTAVDDVYGKVRGTPFGGPTK